MRLRGELDTTDIERIYRAVADGDARSDVLQMIYDTFGQSCELRPPLLEQRVAATCKPKAA